MRLIDADELTDRLNHTTMVAYPNLFPGLLAAVEVVDDAPTIEAEPVVHAHWIVLDDDYSGKPVYCSNCHEHFVLSRAVTVEQMKKRQKRCFNCGAKMDLEVAGRD